MAFNELEAMKMLDEGKISDKEIKLLTRLRDGVALAEVEDDAEYKELETKGLVEAATLSHPRASVQVQAVIPSERGTTVLNLFDKRFRENTGASVDANTAPEVEPKIVKAPTDEEARKVPSLETKPLAEKDKNLGFKPATEKEAMKDPLVQAGAKDVARAAKDDEKTIANNAKVTVEKR